MVKLNFNGSAVLLWFRDSFGFKKAKIKKMKILDLILSVNPINSVLTFRFNAVILCIFNVIKGLSCLKAISNDSS